MIDAVETAIEASFPAGCGTDIHRGATWTTDAPYRETAAAIALAATQGALRSTRSPRRNASP